MATSSLLASNRHLKNDPNIPDELGLPFPAQFLEMCLQKGGVAQRDQLACVVTQMKRELEMGRPRRDVASWDAEARKGAMAEVCILIAVVGALEQGKGKA